MSESEHSGTIEESASCSTTPAETSVIMGALGQYIGRSTGMYTAATGLAIPVGIVSAIVTVQYLSPAQFGQLGLLMVLAGFLTIFYNIGLLHGTFLWVYGSSGEGDDVEVEGGFGRADAVVQRRAMGTGLILTLLVVIAGTIVCFTFAGSLAALLLGSAHRANLIGLAAISGGAGSIYRLTSNLFRFERRPAAFAVAMAARPVSVLVVSTALIVAGYGVWGAVLGIALPTIGCAIACMLASRRSYALAFTLEDARQIIVRGGGLVVPVAVLWFLHNGDLYLLVHWVHGASLGVYRLASRLGSPPSYFASAFIMVWCPAERSPLVMAAFKARGMAQVRTMVNTYYLIIGLTIIVMLVLFSRFFLLAAPRSYADAANIVPLIALAYVTYGAYIILIRTVRPDKMMTAYAVTVVMSAVTFIGWSFLLIPTLGVYGAPLALTLAMATGCLAVLWLNSRKKDKLPMEWGRMFAATAVAATVSGVGLAGSQAVQPVATLTTVLALAAYFPALVLTRAIPASHLPLLLSVVTRGRSGPKVRLRLDQLPVAEQEALERLRLGKLDGSWSAVEYARLVRGLRRIAEIGSSSAADARIGRYVASSEPESIRDFQMRALIEDGADAFELYNLDRLAKAARRGELQPRRSRGGRGGALRAHARGLGVEERARLRASVAAAGVLAHENGHASVGKPPALAQVRAVRSMRGALSVGTASAADPALARALWNDEGEELSRHERIELRRLKAAARLASRPPGGQVRRRPPI